MGQCYVQMQGKARVLERIEELTSQRLVSCERGFYMNMPTKKIKIRTL